MQSNNTHSPQQSGRILVIDDDRDITELIQLACADLGETVLVSHSVNEGLAMFREHGDEINLVLLDLALQGHSGIQLLEQIRALSDRARVIIMSGYINNENEARALGAHGMLTKPFNLQELEDLVVSMQERERDTV